MSEENVEIVRAAFSAYERADMDAVLRLCDEDIEITQDAKLLGAPGHQHGHDGVREAFALWPEQWDDFRVEVLRLDDFGDHVMVDTVNHGRGKDSGVPVEMPFTFLFRLRGGKITEWQLFFDEAQALEAVGPAGQAMAQDDVEVVRALFVATNQRDFAAAMNAYADDVVLVVTGFFPSGTFVGREAVGTWFGDWFSAFGRDYRFEVKDARAVGERVFVVASHHGSGRASGATVEATTFYAYTVTAGKIARVEMYTERADALEAVGAAE